MIRNYLFISILISSLFSQSDDEIVSTYLARSDDQIEFKLNTISGVVSDSITTDLLMDVDIEIYTGNKILKHSLITNEMGYFSKENVGYLWKPKIRVTLKNYKTKVFQLNPDRLDSNNNVVVNIPLTPLPMNDRVTDLDRSTLTKRSETFFIRGNVFYNRISSNNAQRIIINSAEAIEIRPKYIAIKVNGLMYDVVNCYVPQGGKYENLSYILRSLLGDPLFKESGYPVHLSEYLLEPSVIFGSVFNKNNNAPIDGAEIILTESKISDNNIDNDTSNLISMSEYYSKENSINHTHGHHRYNTFKRRASDQNGQYAFTIDKPGIYQLTITPPSGFSARTSGNPYIIVQYGRGGWYQSNFYLNP